MDMVAHTTDNLLSCGETRTHVLLDSIIYLSVNLALEYNLVHVQCMCTMQTLILDSVLLS